MLTEKQIKSAKKNLLMLHNGLVSDWQFGKVRTWKALYYKLGVEPTGDVNKEITFPELKAFLKKREDEYEQSLQTQPRVEQEVRSEVPITSMRLEGNCRVDSTTLPTNSQRSVAPAVPVQIDLRIPETPRVPEVTVVQLSPNSNDAAKDKGAEGDYGLVHNPNWKVFHYWFQKKAIKEALDKILGFDTSLAGGSMEKLKEMYNDPAVVKKPATGILILSATGTGKTFIVAALARILWDLEYHEGKTFSHIPYLWITKATVVQQASRVLKRFYNLEPVNDVEVINIEQLRSKTGELWLKKEIKIERGEEVVDWQWKKGLQPCVVFFDESQGAKNQDSTQSTIIQKYNDLPSNALLVSVSATPFARISDAKYFAVSTHRKLDHLGFPMGSRLTNGNWQTYSNMIASPASPKDYNKASVDRLMDDLDPWIIRVTNVRPQFKAINSVKVIPFESKEKREFYQQAWERFLKEKAKLDALKEAGDSSSEVCMFTILLKFAMAAELCHADHFAKDMHTDVQNGYAAVGCCKQKGTIIEIVRQLITKYGVKRDQISLVWGGGQTQLTKKQKDKQKILAMEEKFKAMGLTSEEMLMDMGLEDVEDRKIEDLPKEWRLGAQTQEERQEEIDRFQSGKSLYCLYTFKAGGVGLSLHHSDELTKEKVKRKESGYAYEEDIPKVPVRPRKAHIMLTYNAMELVQGVGRCPRLTSLSHTVQQVYAYEGTIEVDIGNIVSQKLRCLTAVVKQKESWQDVILNGNNSTARAQKVKEILDKTDGIVEEEGVLIDEGGEEDEE